MSGENTKKIIPAYERKNQENKKEKNKKKTDKKMFKSKFTLILIVIVALIIFLLIFGVAKIVENIKYKEYSNKMNTYGFNLLYDDKKITSSSSVTKAELAKLVLGATFNRYDIIELLPENIIIQKVYSENEEEVVINPDEIGEDDIIISEPYEETYKNSMWVDYMLLNNIVSEEKLNKELSTKTATLMDALEYIIMVKKDVLKIELNASEKPSFSDYNKYTPDEQTIIADAVKSGIIDNKKGRLNAKKNITKEELNKLIIKYVEIYNLITIGDSKLNINKEKIPNNVKNYPFTISSVEKSVYEIQDYKKNEKEYKTPKQIYPDMKERYSEINEKSKIYFDTILNINYEELTDEKIEEIQDNLDVMASYYTNIDLFDNYIEYVRENKIKITGSSKVAQPAIYYDGESYRVRVKLDFTVESSDTLDNILFQDLSLDSNYTYKTGKNELVVDVALKLKESSDNIYIYSVPVSTIIAGSVRQ